MPSLIAFPSGFSPAAVEQTLVRAENAAQYAQAFEPPESLRQNAGEWRIPLATGNAESLTDCLRRHDVTPLVRLTERERNMVYALALIHPPFRAELQDASSRIERSIGVSMPLRMSVQSGLAPHTNLVRGMTVLLDPPQDLPSSQTVQFFRPGSSSQKSEISSNLLNTIHSPKIHGHFAEKEIRRIASYRLKGERIVPLSSPSLVSLSSVHLTRVGRFTFLGIDFSADHFDPEGNWNRLVRFQDQADILILGGLSGVQPDAAARLMAFLRPRITLIASEDSQLFRAKDCGIAALISPRADAEFELDPSSQRFTVFQGSKNLSIAWERSNRYLEALSRVRAQVTRTIFGSILEDRRKWRWSQAIMNGVIPQALRYLRLLDASPDLTIAVASREELLIEIIDQLTHGVTLPGADTDHVAAFSEILLQSGFLERAGGK